MLPVLTLAAAAVALALSLGAGPAVRYEILPLGDAFNMMKWGTYAGLGAAGLAILELLIPRARRNAAAVLIAALVVGLAAAAPPVYMLQLAKSLPPIHDVTTDAQDVPRFEALARAREESPNKAAYDPKDAAQQKAGYPDIEPLQLALPPDQAFARALEAARAERWEIAAADAAKGSIEATATTLWFGFKDDVVVRVRAADGGSRIDVRSASRVGESDLGANAKRVRSYLARLR